MRTLRSVALTSGVLLVGMAIGIAIVQDPTPDRDPAAPQIPVREVVAVDTSDVAVPGESVGGVQPPTLVTGERSPELAAVRFLELTEDVVLLSPDDGAEMQRAIATSDASERLASEVLDLLTQLETDVPEGVAVHLAPLSLSSVETSTGWDVSIWYVEVIVYGDQLAVEQWRTATYSLIAEDGEWRMDDLESVDGPIPTRPASAVGWSATALTSAIAGFNDEVLLS